MRSICNSFLVILLLYASLSGSLGEDEILPASKPGSCVQGSEELSTQGDTCTGDTTDTTPEIEEGTTLAGDTIETQLEEVNHIHSWFGISSVPSDVSKIVYDTASSAKDYVFSHVDAYLKELRKIIKDEFVYLIADGVADILKRITSPGTYVLGFNVGLVLPIVEQNHDNSGYLTSHILSIRLYRMVLVLVTPVQLS